MDDDIDRVEEAEDLSLVPDATFEDILCEYEIDEGEFVFYVGKKKKRYVGMRLANLSDSLKLGDDAQKFREHYEKIRKTPAPQVPEMHREWKKFATRPMDIKAAIMILAITRLLISPKLSQLQCLRLHARGGQALMDIGGPLFSGATTTAYENEFEAVEEAKND